MKKIKLIAPILGAAATLGTAIPLVSCNNAYVVEVVGSPETAGEVVNVISETKATAGKDFYAEIEWQHFESEGAEKPYDYSFLFGVTAYEVEGEKLKEIDPQNVVTKVLGYGKFSIAIEGKYVPNKMRIEFTADKVDEAKVFEVNEGHFAEENVIYGYKGSGLFRRYVPMNGVACTPFEKLTTSDYILEFTTPISKLDSILTSMFEYPSLAEQGATNLYVAIQKSDQTRSTPWAAGGVKLINQQTKEVREISASFSEQTYSLTVPINITEEMIKDGNWTLVGWFSYDISTPWIDLNKGMFTIIPEIARK